MFISLWIWYFVIIAYCWLERNYLSQGQQIPRHNNNPVSMAFINKLANPGPIPYPRPHQMPASSWTSTCETLTSFPNQSWVRYKTTRSSSYILEHTEITPIIQSEIWSAHLQCSAHSSPRKTIIKSFPQFSSLSLCLWPIPVFSLVTLCSMAYCPLGNCEE